MHTVQLDTTEPLHGELVDVRELRESDAPTLFDMLTDPQVVEGMSPPPPSVDAFRGFIEWARRERAMTRSVCFGIVPRGLESAVGVIQLRAQEPSWFTAEWGFAIGVPFWGTGAFVEAAQLVAAYAFDRVGVHRLEARAVTDNGRGNGALQKLGARAEGTLDRSFHRGNGYHTQFLWALHADDWRQGRLFTRRFSRAQALEQIAAAIHDVRQRLGTTRPSPSEPPALYPFFIVDR